GENALPRTLTNFALSFSAQVFFALLFIWLAVSCVRLRLYPSKISLTHGLRNKPLALQLLLLGASLLSVVDRAATTKVTWMESRGIPVAWLHVSDLLFACDLDALVCGKRTFESLEPLALAFGVLLFFFVAQLMTQDPAMTAA
ncbi:MAG: hypothetical protein M8467_19130, partial [Anaerolineae bacterium]|nr:hypothetical protein [Anaerolineae bacterium]